MKKEMKKARRFAVLLTAMALTAGFSLPMLNNAADTVSLVASAEDDENYTEGSNDTFYYLKYADHISVYGLKSEPENLVIPDTIDNLPVTKIQMYSFNYLSIKSVTFPDSLKEIDSYSFTDCTNLTEVTLPANIERLGFHVFENCTSLKTVNFPDHLVKTSDFTFDNTPWLDAQRKIDPLVIVNGALIDARTTTGDVKVPSEVKYVATGAFSKNDKVTSVVIPMGVTEIGDNTFWMCSNLTSVDIKGAENLGMTAFGYCEKLSDLKLSNKLKSVLMMCFTDAANAGTITFYGTENEWKNVEVEDFDNDFIKNSKVIFDSTPIDEPDEPKEVVGDINMDGALTTADAVLLHRWLLTEPDVELKNWKAGDMNADGELTSADLSLLKNELLKG